MSLAEQRLTPREYLDIERKAEYKSEFFHGRMYARAGATQRHNLIAVNVTSELRSQFKGRQCKVFSNDMRVKVMATGLYTYPDVVALCQEARFEDDTEDTLLNPEVIVEVLSPSTEGYDRGDKFAHYREVDTVGDYVLISQDRVHVEHFVRQPDGRWLLEEHKDLHETLDLPSIDCRLPLAEIYDKVEFEQADNHLPGYL